MNIIATLLILGASGSAERSAEYNQTILGIVGQCVVGGVRDALQGTGGRIDLGGTTIGRPALHIDGRPVTGIAAWAAATNRIAGYALDRQTEGSIGLAYRISARGYDIDTTSVYRDGFVSKSFSTGWTEVVRIPVPKR